MSEKQTFASHERAQFWSSKNIGCPADYALNSHKKCWFDCDCGHSFEQDLNHINTSNRWCAYCSHQKLCNNDACKLMVPSFGADQKLRMRSDIRRASKRNCGSRMLDFGSSHCRSDVGSYPIGRKVRPMRRCAHGSNRPCLREKNFLIL